jgi:hypothetical protein
VWVALFLLLLPAEELISVFAPSLEFFFYRWTQEAEAAAPWIAGSLTSEALISFISNCFCHGGLA